MKEIEIGAHLVSQRIGYTHHGIYIGNELVIHYSGLSDGLSSGPVEIISLSKFSLKRDVRIIKHDNPKYSGKTAVERAISRIGENKYDLHANNCEHFCTWAITGEANSSQVTLFENILNLALKDMHADTKNKIKTTIHSVLKAATQRP